MGLCVIIAGLIIAGVVAYLIPEFWAIIKTIGTLIIQFSIFVIAFAVEYLLYRKRTKIDKIIKESVVISFLVITIVNFGIALVVNECIRDEVSNYILLRNKKKEMELAEKFGMELSQRSKDIWGGEIVELLDKETGNILLISTGRDKILDENDQVITVLKRTPF